MPAFRHFLFSTFIITLPCNGSTYPQIRVLKAHKKLELSKTVGIDKLKRVVVVYEQYAVIHFSLKFEDALETFQITVCLYGF